MIPAFGERREADGKQKASRLVKGQKRVFGRCYRRRYERPVSREDERRDALNAERDEAWRYKSCERKNRYDTRAEAEAVMADCENRGRRGLACYKCEYCGGWHLTSHPWK